MSNSFIAAARTKETIGRTENGAKTFISSIDQIVDVFFMMGAVRTTSDSRKNEIINKILTICETEPLVGMSLLIYLRDIRNGGLGERDLFRKVVSNQRLVSLYGKERVFRLAEKTHEFGRFDDLFHFQGIDTIDIIGRLLTDDDYKSLACKWFPRKGPWFVRMHKELNKTPKELRKYLVNNSSTVEQKISSKQYKKMDYSKIPSLAGLKYIKAFYRNDELRYKKFIDSVKSGKKKINTSVNVPVDIVKAYLAKSDDSALSVMWEDMKKKFNLSAKFLPLIDVSSSMSSAGVMDDSISIGMFLAECNNSSLKDSFITFHERPEMLTVKGDSFGAKYRYVKGSRWGGSTNLIAAFQLILEATKASSPADVPDYLIILSDMEFNAACSGITNFQNIKIMYDDAGIKMPQIIFWNLASRHDNIPVRVNENGVALVSGKNPAIVKTVLSGDLSPRSVVDRTLNRYRTITEYVIG